MVQRKCVTWLSRVLGIQNENEGSRAVTLWMKDSLEGQVQGENFQAGGKISETWGILSFPSIRPAGTKSEVVPRSQDDDPDG